MARNVFSSSNIGIAVAVLAVSAVALPAGQSPGGAVPMDSDDIAGVVTGPNGPEAGVWVIAETRDLPTRHVKIVVTDDAGVLEVEVGLFPVRGVRGCPNHV